MLNVRSFFGVLALSVGAVGTWACQSPVVSPAQEAYEAVLVDVSPQRFALFGRGPVYAALPPLGPEKRAFVAEVHLGGSGRPDGARLLADSLRTGDPVYTLVSEPLARSELEDDKAALLGWSGALYRGYTRATGEVLLQDVQVKLVWRFLPTPIARKSLGASREPSACSLFLFGNRGELFALVGSNEGAAEIWRARVAEGVFSQKEASAVREGVCVTLNDEALPAAKKKAHWRGTTSVSAQVQTIEGDLLELLTEL